MLRVEFGFSAMVELNIAHNAILLAQNSMITMEHNFAINTRKCSNLNQMSIFVRHSPWNSFNLVVVLRTSLVEVATSVLVKFFDNPLGIRFIVEVIKCTSFVCEGWPAWGGGGLTCRPGASVSHPSVHRVPQRERPGHHRALGMGLL